MDVEAGPIEQLTRFERALLAVANERGVRAFVVVITGLSVVLSLAMTATLMAASGGDRDDFVFAMSVATAVPACVAPAAAVVLGRVLCALDRASAEMHELARTDALTGVLNRRAFAGEAEAVVGLVGDRHLLVAMVDIDDFKGVNDAHGHATGDRVLVALASRLADVVGAEGRVGRFGGDEFVVCASADAERATDIEAALLGACDLSDVAPGVAASIGVHVAAPGEPLAEAMAHADHALYGEKRVRGRIPVTATGGSNTERGVHRAG